MRGRAGDSLNVILCLSHEERTEQKLVDNRGRLLLRFPELDGSAIRSVRRNAFYCVRGFEIWFRYLKLRGPGEVDYCSVGIQYSTVQ